MAYCRNCGKSLRDGARFCACCGTGIPDLALGPAQSSPPTAPYAHAPYPLAEQRQPPPAVYTPTRPGVTSSPGRRGARMALVVGAAILVAAVAGFVVFPRSTAASGTTVPATAPSPVPGTALKRDASVPVLRPRDPIGQDELDRQVATDRATAELLVGSWVPQLSSVQLSTAIGGGTVDAAAVLADFANLKGQFPRSVLVRSDDYSSFQQGGYWVALVAQPFRQRPTPTPGVTPWD